MSPKTRYLLFGAAALLTAGLGGGLVAYYLASPGQGGLDAEAEDLRLIPGDATVVAFADVRAIMASELRQRLRELLPQPPGADSPGRREFAEQTGIDIERDVDHVVASLLPASGDGGTQQGLVLVRGRIEEAPLERLAQQAGAQAETYRGKRLFVRPIGPARVPLPTPESPLPTPEPPLQTPDAPAPRTNWFPQLAVSLIRPGLVAVGTTAALRRVIDLEGGGENVTGNADLMRLVGELRANDDIGPDQLWVVGRFDQLMARARLPEGVEARLPPITYLALGGRVNGGLSGRLRAETRDEAAAQQLDEIVRGFIALAKMQTGGKLGLDSVLQSFQLRTSGTAVELAFVLPAGVLTSLLPASPQPSP